MAKIAAYAMKNSEFRKIVGTQRSVIRWVFPAGKTYQADTTNQLLGSYSGASGIKTGWTNAAKGCLAAAAKRGGVELIAIILKSPDGQTRFADARKLLDYGFSVGGKGQIVTEQVTKTSAKPAPKVLKPSHTAKPVTPATTVTGNPADKTKITMPVFSSEPISQKTATSGISPTVKTNPKPVVQKSTVPVATNTNVVSNKPVVKNTSIRMPVVRKPGA